MDLQFLVRITLQYALARYAVWVGEPRAARLIVGFDIYSNQQLTIAEYLAIASRAGWASRALNGRTGSPSPFGNIWFDAVDRWFLLEPSDQSRTLARLEQRYRIRRQPARRDRQRSPEELRPGAAREVASRCYFSTTMGASWSQSRASTGPIRRESALLEIVRSTRGRCPARFSCAWVDSATAAARWIGSGWKTLMPNCCLPLVRVDRGCSWAWWLSATHGPVSRTTAAQLCTGGGGQLVEPPCSIENSRLRGFEADAVASLGVTVGPQGLDWQRRARSVLSSVVLWSGVPKTRQCSCGTRYRHAAALPLFVQGKFRLERLDRRGRHGRRLLGSRHGPRPSRRDQDASLTPVRVGRPPVP